MDSNTYPNIDFSQINEVDKMQTETLQILDAMIERANYVMQWKFHINSSYREGDPKSHGKGQAIDGYFYKDVPSDVPLADQLIFALQFNWKGIGYYPHWNTPGIHIDNRDGIAWTKRRAIWRREKNGQYAVGFRGVSEALTA